MNASEIRSTLDELRHMALHMASIPEDHRIFAYKSVDPLFLRLEGYLSRHPETRASKVLDEIRMNVIAMARLEETAEEPDAVYAQQVDSLIEELGAILCP